MADVANDAVVILDGSEDQGDDVEMTEIQAGENLDDIAGDTASEDEDEEDASNEEAESSGEDEDAEEEEDVDAEVVLEELSFAARKKLEEAVKCVLLPTPTRSLSRTPTRRDGHATHATHTTVA